MADVATTNTQVQEAKSLLDDGTPYGEIIKILGPQWGVCVNTVKSRIAVARAEIGRLDDERRGYERGKMLTQIDATYSAAWGQHNLQVCLKALDLKAKLLGLNAPLQVEDVTDKDRPLHEWPDEKLAARLAELRSNGGAGPH